MTTLFTDKSFRSKIFSSVSWQSSKIGLVAYSYFRVDCYDRGPALPHFVWQSLRTHLEMAPKSPPQHAADKAAEARIEAKETRAEVNLKQFNPFQNAAKKKAEEQARGSN